MTTRWMAVLAVGLAAAQVSAATKPATPKPAAPKPQTAKPEAKQTITLKTQDDKVSYLIGVNIGRNFKQQGIKINADVLSKAIKDVLTDGKLLMTEEEMQSTGMAFQQEMMQKQMKARAAEGETNKKAEDAFLAENGKKEGVITLPSGLQYKILKAGDGKKPTDADSVECNYRGTLINGTEFDSSYSRGQAATFKVTGVIPGWTEALKLMPVGSKWQLFIPSKLGYGEMGNGPDIGPNATLIFELELLAIK